MKYLISVIVLSLLLTTSVFSQNVVSGKIVTEVSDEPLTGANVMIKNGENKLVKFCITDANGSFRIDMGEKQAEGLFLHFVFFMKKLSAKELLYVMVGERSPESDYCDSLNAMINGEEWRNKSSEEKARIMVLAKIL